MFRVLVITHPLAPRGVYYSVYRDRKLAVPVRYGYKGEAIQACVQLCCVEQEEKERRDAV